MDTVAPVPKAKHRKKLPIELRARSVPYKRPFVLALFCSALFFLTLVGALAALFALFAAPGKNNAVLLIGFIGFTILFWLLSYFQRRKAHCPLCKGTPFLDSAAHCHVKAVRFFPLNHGTSNVLRCMMRQHFRCQFCGTPFDLLKPVTKFGEQGQE